MSSSSSSSASVSTGGGFSLLLFAVLLVLKVNPGGNLDSQVEDWSWWIITAPLWAGLAILLLILAIVGIVFGVCAILDHLAEKKRRKRMAERRAARTTQRF